MLPYKQDILAQQLKYTKQDLAQLFRDAGFTLDTTEVHWVSKFMVLTKPLAPEPAAVTAVDVVQAITAAEEVVTKPLAPELAAITAVEAVQAVAAVEEVQVELSAGRSLVELNIQGGRSCKQRTSIIEVQLTK